MQLQLVELWFDPALLEVTLVFQVCWLNLWDVGGSCSLVSQKLIYSKVPEMFAGNCPCK